MSVTRAVARVSAAPAHPSAQLATRVRAALAGTLATFDGTVIAERLPAGAWDTPALRPVRGDARVRDALTRRVRDAFDPARVLNRGILGAAGGDA